MINITPTIIKHLRRKAYLLTKRAQDQYRGNHNDMNCKILAAQADILRELANEIEGGAHFESDSTWENNS